MVDDNNHNNTETAKRRDMALRRALSTPPKPKQAPVKPKKQKPKAQLKKDQG
ncbi:MAG: hypothetical protein KDI98_08745 [Hyphomicrobiaceae bacterium]|nr:hypothetical protein [Hyphomicrobiaceae bacterium]